MSDDTTKKKLKGANLSFQANVLLNAVESSQDFHIIQLIPG